MAEPGPLTFRWEGDCFIPRIEHRDECDQRYVVGQEYKLVEYEDRSSKSHRHEFVWLHEAWLQLPEGLRNQYPSSEHLRKAALIEAGFFYKEAIYFGTEEAAFQALPWLRSQDEFCLVKQSGAFLLRFRAKSQRKHGPGAMSKAEFQRSKDAILDIVSNLIGIEPHELRRNAGRAA